MRNHITFRPNIGTLGWFFTNQICAIYLIFMFYTYRGMYLFYYDACVVFFSVRLNDPIFRCSTSSESILDHIGMWFFRISSSFLYNWQINTGNNDSIIFYIVLFSVVPIKGWCTVLFLNFKLYIVLTICSS